MGWMQTIIVLGCLVVAAVLLQIRENKKKTAKQDDCAAEETE